MKLNEPGKQTSRLAKLYSDLLLLGTQDQQLGVEQEQLLCGPTGTSSSNCHEIKTCMVQAFCHDSLSKTILQGTQEGGQCRVWQRGNAGWTTSKSGRPCPCRNCSQGPSAEKKKWKKISAELSLMSPGWPDRSWDWIEQILTFSMLERGNFPWVWILSIGISVLHAKTPSWGLPTRNVFQKGIQQTFWSFCLKTNKKSE